MSIRWNIRDCVSGEIHIVDAPKVSHKKRDPKTGKAIYGSFIDEGVRDRLMSTVERHTTVGQHLKRKPHAHSQSRADRRSPGNRNVAR